MFTEIFPLIGCRQCHQLRILEHWEYEWLVWLWYENHSIIPLEVISVLLLKPFSTSFVFASCGNCWNLCFCYENFNDTQIHSIIQSPIVLIFHCLFRFILFDFISPYEPTSFKWIIVFLFYMHNCQITKPVFVNQICSTSTGCI